MSDMFGSSKSAPSSTSESVGEQTRALRESYIRAPNGDYVGNNYVVPKGDFSKHLGYKEATPQELSGEKPLSGSRIIEIALQKEMQDLGERAAKNGNSYRNIHISWGRFGNEPGRERDMLRDARDAIAAGPDKNSIEDKVGRMIPSSGGTAPYFQKLQDMQTSSRNDNIRYMEMQYKFMEMSKQEGTISNLMKTRHDAVSRGIRGGQG